MRGFRESEALTYCNFATDQIRVPFNVRDCSNWLQLFGQNVADLGPDAGPGYRNSRNANLEGVGLPRGARV
jgi:hypothetical protein